MAFIDFESKAGKKRMHYIYSLGASVVILGALFKILHLPGGDWVIGAGLLTEAFIFFLSAFEPVPEDLHWERVYPELADDSDSSMFAKSDKRVNAEVKNVETAFSDKLDKLLADAKLDAAKIERLGEGLEKFVEATNGLTVVADANKNAQSYSDQLAIAANHMSIINSFYEANAAKAETQSKINESFIKAAESSTKYGEELSKAADNVQAMNKIYSDQIQNITYQVHASGDMVKNISVSVEDAKKMHEEVKKLTANLSSLNNVYGGMLSAMNLNK